jgi:cullin 1
MKNSNRRGSFENDNVYICLSRLCLPMDANVIEFETGWQRLKTGGIDKLEYFLNTGKAPAGCPPSEPGKPVRIFGTDEYAELYTYVTFYLQPHYFPLLRLVYNMCTQPNQKCMAEKLYIRYGETLAYYLQQKVMPALTGKSGIALLSEVRYRWNNHKIYIKWMDRFFQYLDRYHIKIRSLDTVRQRGLMIFKTLIFDHISEETTKGLLDLVNSERQGFEVPEDVIKSVIEMYIELGVKGLVVYQKEFEELLLPATSSYYAHLSEQWLSESIELSEYLTRAELALSEEDNRVSRYLHSSTLPKLRGVVIMQLLTERQRVLLSMPSGVTTLLSAERLGDVSRVYRLFSLVDNGLVPIAASFRQFVTEKGNALVEAREQQLKTIVSKQDALNDPTFVQSLIDLHDQYKSTVSQCFQSDTAFQKSLKEAFEVFVNREMGEGAISISALMSSFCDRILRKSGGERMSYDEIEVAITKLVDLFSFLADKDEFSEIYRNQLSKRLLSDSTSSEDAEKSLIQKLKMKCGANFTSKLEGMITDLSQASEAQRKFRESSVSSKLNSGREAVDFIPIVLTTGFWPTYAAIETNLPPQLSHSLSVFSEYYSKQFPNRKLNWIHSLGTATIVGRFDETRKFDLVMNTFQGLILLLFNAHNSLTCAEIAKQLNLEEGFTNKLLATMIFSKFKVLNREIVSAQSSDPSAGKTPLESTDVISVNDEFTVPHRRIKIPPPTAGTDETHNKSKVEEDRSFSIEAAIVRVMKTRKVLTHQQLIAEVVSQLTIFKPTPKSIKQRIENLIEREFLERDPENINLYKYLA